MGGKHQMKHLVPIIIILLLVSTSFVGVGNQIEELMVDGEDKVNDDVNKPITFNNSQTEHIWPTQGYNRTHIGRSPYSTANNPGIERWRFPADDWCDGSPVIAEDGTIYFGATTLDSHLYAINPDGTLKWKFETASGLGEFGSSPAIAEDGTIYVGTKFGSYVQAINPNGTEKWKYKATNIDTSITIGPDGIIYYGYKVGVDARFPNGTKKWTFQTNDIVQSTPAVDDNGIIYFGSHDRHIYAVYPNGTMKWKFKTGSWVHGSPSIGTDGTIYCGSDDDYLYALYPNGTLRWKEKIIGSVRASPSQDKDGNLYFGTSSGVVTSVASNGTTRWEFELGIWDSIWGSTVAISDDGTIYVGNNMNYDIMGNGEIIALDLNGNLKWRKIISDMVCESSPVIDQDGNVYICASQGGIGPDAWGYLHCFGPQESNNPPDTPSIEGPDEGEIKEWYTFKVSSDDSDNNPVGYIVDWGDGNKGLIRDYAPGLKATIGHQWDKKGNYTIKVKARDTFGAESDWAYHEVTMPHSYDNPFLWLDSLLDRFPLLQRLLEGLIR